MTENPQPENDLTEEFRNLGKNLVEVLRTAWDSPERKRLQQDIEDGLNEVGSTLRKEVENFSTGPTGQQLKTDVEELGERFRSGEAQAHVRNELLGALQMANIELQKVIERISAAQTGDRPEAASAPESKQTE
jgi:hypothetical protein